MKRMALLSEYWQFLKEERKYWLIPILVIFFLLGALAVLLEGSAVAPFIYAIF